MRGLNAQVSQEVSSLLVTKVMRVARFQGRGTERCNESLAG